MAEENHFSIAPVAQAAPSAPTSNLDGQEEEAEGGGGCFCCWWMQDSDEDEELERTNSGLQRTDSGAADGGKKKKKLKRKKPPPKTSWGSPAGSKRMSTSMTPPSRCIEPTAGVSEVSAVSPPTAFAEVDDGEEDAFANSPSAVISMRTGGANESGLPPSGKGSPRATSSSTRHHPPQPDFSIDGQQLKKAPSLGAFSAVGRRDTSGTANPPGFSSAEVETRNTSPRKHGGRSGIVAGSFSTSPEVNRAVDDRVLMRHESASHPAGAGGTRPGSFHNTASNPFTLANAKESKGQPKSRSFDDSDED